MVILEIVVCSHPKVSLNSLRFCLGPINGIRGQSCNDNRHIENQGEVVFSRLKKPPNSLHF